MFYINLTMFLIASVLVTLFSYYCSLFYNLDLYREWFFVNTDDGLTYDYIIVGAGSAGSLLAARLAKMGQKVLLIEAGGEAPPFFDMPLIAPLLQGSPYDWQYSTVPQENACKGLINNISKWPMGKILGGSGRLNYMAYVRGHPLDYDDWFPDFVEPTMEKGGSMKISELVWSTPLADAVLKAAEEKLLPVINLNRDSNIGFMKVELSMTNGKRWSTDQLLKDNLHGLSIKNHALVNKIIVDSGTAIGVEYQKLGKNFKAYAKNGVISSAGTIGSAKLLLLSGIGPKSDLEKLQIDVITDLPVGQHLVDHILTGIDLVKLNASVSLSISQTFNPISALNYFLYGKGPWTSSGIEVVGTFHSGLLKNKSLSPDLQLMVLPAGLAGDHGIVLKKAMGISDKIYEEYFAPHGYDYSVTFAPVLLHPKSTGEIKLRSTDPLDEPLINPKYLSNFDDVLTLIEGIEFIKELLETRALKALGATLYNKKFPGCEGYTFDTKKYWECYVRHLTLTSYHPAGSCRMGDVVDSSFRVHNIKNLYVVDASVLPRLPSGNINAAVLMLAEKAARLFNQNNKSKLMDSPGLCTISCQVFFLCRDSHVHTIDN